MKRSILFLLCALLALGTACMLPLPKADAALVQTRSPEAVDSEAEPAEASALQSETEQPTATQPEPAPIESEAANAPALPIVFRLYDELGWDVSDAVMFSYDFNRDGVAEDIAFSLNEEDDTTTILVGNQRMELDISSMLDTVILLDLDPESPELNLLVVIDEASDDYVVTELHLEDGTLTVGPVVYGFAFWKEDALWISERTDVLGTSSGSRVYAGDDLKPVSEWLELDYVPTEEEIAEERDSLIEGGVLLHTTRKLPCTINGKDAKIAKDAYVYPVRICADQTEAELRTLDGKALLLSFECSEEGYPERIAGKSIEKYFDNLSYAD